MALSRSKWRIWVICLAGLVLVGYLGWRLAPGDPTAELRDSLPGNPPLQLMVNTGEARRSPSAKVLFDAWLGSSQGAFARQAGLLEIGTPDLVFVSADAEGAYLAAGGSFSTEALHQAVERLGGRCPELPREHPCTIPGDSPEWFVSLLLPSDSRLLLTYTGSSGDVEGMRERAASIRGVPRLPEAEAALGEETLAKIVMIPRGLAAVVQQPSLPFLPNLNVVMRAFEKAERVSFTVSDRRDRGLLGRLEAIAGTETEAQELRDLVSGLTEFAAVAADYGRGDKEPSDWARILRSARFEQAGSVVTVLWSFEKDALQRLAED